MATPVPSVGPSPLTGDPVIDAMTTGYRWTLGADRTIDWSISGGFIGEFWASPEAVRGQLQAALSTIEAFADVRFNYVGHFSTPSAAAAAGSEINVAPSTEARFFSSNNVWAIGHFPTTQSDSDAGYAGAAGDIFLNLNSAAGALSSYEPGSAGFFLLLHEIGHALGLKHPHDDGGTGRPTLADAGFEGLDTDWATMMAYRDDYGFDLRLYDPATPMVLDVLALRALYGPNMTTFAGDDTHVLRAFGRYETVWDAGGQDEVSAAGSIRGWFIYLPDDSMSSSDPVRIGFASPLDELDLDSPESLIWLMGDLENALGSDNDDEIYGSVQRNVLRGGGGHDYMDGWDGDDTLDGGAGDDIVWGGLGDDSIADTGGGSNYLRGEEGNDSVVGGAGFDDINGNMGDDTASGGLGEDWVVGGKDDDVLSGGDAFDIVYGNLGSDTLYGDAGDDIVRGGQQDDVLFGGAGDDYVSGDRDSDTITGGAGADTFHSFAEAGLDRVLDFNRAEGDRVLLDAGTAYTVAQIGADTVITMSAGQLVLVGVSMSSLTGDWITVG